MTGAEARKDEATSTKAIFSAGVSKGEVARSEEPWERGDGTGSGWINGLVQGCRIQRARHFYDLDSAAKDLIDLFLGIEDGAGLRLRSDPPNEEASKEHFINLFCPNPGSALLPGNLFVTCCTLIHTRRES